jgi:hypothetical protein
MVSSGAEKARHGEGFAADRQLEDRYASSLASDQHIEAAY